MITFENPIVRQLINLADSIVTNVTSCDYVSEQALVKDFEDEARSLGYIKLGAGYFSQAWTHPEIKRYAIKLGFKKEDSGAAYAAYCRNNQGKAGIPVIYGLERFRSCYVVLMDKLIDFGRTYKLYMAKKEYFRAKGLELERPRFVTEFNAISEIILDSYFRQKDAETALQETAQDIYEYFKGIARFDLHQGNVMLNKYGEVVITDPVSFVKTEKVQHHADEEARAIKVEPFTIPRWNNEFVNHALLKALEEPMQGVWIDEVQPLELPKQPKCTAKIARGAWGAAKPAFLVQQDARRVFKRR